MGKEEHKTLGRRVVPTSYSIAIEPDLKTFRYKGEESIRVEVRERTRRITLNCAEVRISYASVYCGGETLRAAVSYDAEAETATLTLKRAVYGDASISLAFSGTNNDGMYGFYRSKYVEKGEEKYLLTTQFEAADARKAFPCFDEPEFKATFDVALLVDERLSAISNMPVAKEEPLPRGRKCVSFETTPRMSTYLLYLGVGDFRFVSGRLGKLPVRIAAVPEKIAYARMALGFCIKFIKFFEGYFGVPYPLPKVDLIAVPDFAAGAMENWGAITFREVAILGSERISSVAAKQRIAEVIAHELAHQWFGDLVTMRWWNDIWLNESFATFMATKAVDSTFPKWETGTQYYIETIGTALAADQLRTTHPISVRVNDPGEISEIFDEISYEKGGSVLKMLEDYAGEEGFRKGLNIYLKRHSYSNATKEDLWNAIAQASTGERSKSFAKVAMAWISKAGYPLVMAEQAGSSLRLSQERFMISEKASGGDPWPIPLHYASARGRPQFMLMDKPRARLHEPRAETLKLNYGQKGIYRVQYSPSALDRLGGSIRSGSLGNIDAWGVENDLYSLARSRRVTLKAYLGFIEKHCMDCGYPLNESVSGHLQGLSLLLRGTKAAPEVLRVSLMFHKGMLARLGWRKRFREREVETMLRSTAIVGAGTAGDRETVSRALSLFEGYCRRGKEIDANIRTAVYRLAAMNGTQATLSEMMRLYSVAELPEERQRLLVGMSCFTDPALLRTMLAFSLSGKVRLQDSYIIPSVSTSTPAGRDEIWAWTRGNWGTLRGRFDIGTHMLKHYVENLFAESSERSLAEIRAFYSKTANSRSDISKTVANALELIGVNVRFVEAAEREFE